MRRTSLQSHHQLALWERSEGKNALVLGKLVRIGLNKVDFEAAVNRLDEEGATGCEESIRTSLARERRESTHCEGSCSLYPPSQRHESWGDWGTETESAKRLEELDEKTTHMCVTALPIAASISLSLSTTSPSPPFASIPTIRSLIGVATFAKSIGSRYPNRSVATYTPSKDRTRETT